MPLIPFPNVPAVSGVPDLVRSASAQAAKSSNIISASVSGLLWQVLSDVLNSPWGIYDSDGSPIVDLNWFSSYITIIADVANSITQGLGLTGVISTNSVDYSKETRISEFPIEQGSFASYNKVEVSANPTVRLIMSGSQTERQTFLLAIDAACKSTELYTIVTPEIQYANYSIERYSCSRSARQGMTMLIVDIMLKEIRQVSAKYSNTKNAQQPDGKPTQNNGKVQTTTTQGAF